MGEQYRKEKFESRNEALNWVTENKTIYNSNDDLVTTSHFFGVNVVNDCWRVWHKAIEIVPEKRVIEVWVNVYPNDRILSYETKSEALRCGSANLLGIIKLFREITIVDGKVVEDE